MIIYTQRRWRAEPFGKALNPYRLILALSLTTLALAACDSSSTQRALNSSSGIVSPGEASITSISVTDDQATVDWRLSSGAQAEQWRLYQNDEQVCSGEPTAVASSDDNSTYQTGGCTTSLQSGSNSFYVQLCNFGSSGNSLCSQSISEIIDYQEQLQLGAIYLQDIPNSTSDNQIYVNWTKEEGVNGDYWNLYHNDARVCSGNLVYNEDSFAQSGGCDITLDLGANKFQAELCLSQPVGIDDICTYSATLSSTFSEDLARVLATPYVVDPEESLPAEYDTNIAWVKDISQGSAGENWNLSNNGIVVCQGTIASDASNAGCVISLAEGANLLQVRLCTDVVTYSGATCKSSSIVTVDAFDPNPLAPGIIDISNNVSQSTYQPSLALEWHIVSGNDVNSWSVNLNGEQHCSTGGADSSTDKYYSSGYCLLELALGDNSISVTGCNYGYQDSESCSTSLEVSTEYIVLPGTPELTSSFPATTYESSHLLSWERFDGEAADYWLGMVNDTSKCSADLANETPQSGYCSIQLDSGFNIITARLCLANESGSAYCTDSAAEQVELLAPVPANPEIVTPEQTIFDDIILLEWSKDSGDNGEYWSVDNNGAAVSACSDQPIFSSGSSQSGSCYLPLALGMNLVSVNLCNNNAAGTISCSTSEAVGINRESAAPELTSTTSASTAENNSAVFYIATVSDNDSSEAQISFSLSGADSSLFSINSSGGLAFGTPADYESPQDSDGDNVYQLSLSAIDQTELYDQLELAVSVTNVNDIAPEFTSVDSVSVVENTTGVIHSAQASDVEGDDLGYYLAGADASHFSLDSSSGALAFVNSADYENPQDHDQDNTYELEISTSDGFHSTLQAFAVQLSDSNDETPQATSRQSIALDLSSISLSVVVYTVTASDADAGDQLSYSHAGADASHFSLDPSSGELRFVVLPSGADAEPLDANSDSIYQLEISISDLALNSSSFALTITVADDVGYYPQFDSAHANATIAENSSASFYTALATDPEGGAITYGLSGTDSSFFGIDSVSGELSPLAPLDYERPLDFGSDNNYSLSILASDPLGNQSQQTLDVLVNNINDNAPSFSAQSASISITENSTGSIDVSATDADGDALTYSIAGIDASAFDLDTSTGAVSFRTTPDYENPHDYSSDNTYDFELIASDGAANAEQSFSITIENLNDNAPSFGSPSASISVSENGATFIYTALATDADSGDQVTYSLSGTDSSHFSIDSSSGELSSIDSFDFENPLDADGDNSYDFEIIAADGANSSSLALSVIVSNLNDNEPSFALESDSLSVSENTAGTIYTAVAIDLDGAASLSYGLLGTDAAAFVIDPTSGALSFRSVPDFENPTDYDKDNHYEFEIITSDGISSASLDLQVLVSNVNDIAPVFAYSSYSLAFSENDTSVVYTAVATDPEGDSIAYSIQGADAHLFNIDSTSGALTFLNPPDFENPSDQDGDNHYQLDINASDSVNSTGLRLTIAVEDSNDNSPSFAAASDSVSVPENSSGTVYTAQATDPDATANLTYSLGGTDAQHFSINSTSGAVAFRSSPDFEKPADQSADNNYQIAIEVSDGSNSASLSLTVAVEDSNDNSPSFALSSHSLDVAENTSGTIYTAAASDPDAIDSLSYSLKGTDAHHFTIHSSSGALAFFSAPDFENPTDQNGDQRYQLEIEASDGSNSAVLGLTVEVSNLNDNSPSFAAASESFELPESSSGKVYTAAATDLDGDTITYLLAGSDSSFFTINASSGALNLPTPLDFELPLDQDSDNTYELEIEASDGASSVILTLSIELSDVNDNSPSFAQATEALLIPENSSGVFYTASASDPDLGDSLTYSIQGTDASLFSINASSGELALPAALDFEAPLDQGGDNNYELTVSASDGANSATLALTITVEDLNDNGPRFAQISDAITVAENISGSIYTASATDPDGDLITYSLAGADASFFTLNSSSGVLSLPNALDFETPRDQNTDNNYQLEIQADDGGSSATLSFTVELSDANDNPPSFSMASDTITVAENTSTSFYTAAASDPDATASLSYSLTGVDASLFTLDASSGELAFRSAPDFDLPLDSDQGNDYEITIGVSDGANSASLQLTVQVSNVNDSTPVFVATPALVTYSEASSASVYTAAATDPDGDPIIYSVEGIDASFFSMDPSSGVLGFRSAPDFENPQDQDGDNEYQITLKASDSLNSTSFDLVVSVEDANDNPPGFASSSDFITVFENDSSIIYTATASDPDATAILTYSLTGSDANNFSIDSSSGALSFAVAPDFESPLDQGADNEYQFTISVSDSINSATLDLLVKVEDTNDNAPSFASTSASVSVPENTSGIVYTAQATDIDASASITYSFSTSSGDSSLFALNSSSGEVSLLNALDSEQPIDSNGDNTYQLPITASDGTYSATLDLSITISDVNDNSPNFEPASEIVSVSENSSGVIYTATAVDPDSSAILSYSLLSGLDASHFAIEASSGALSFVTTPDFENPADQDQHNDYELAISVSDSVASASLSLTVVVSDTNDNAPVFVLAADSVSVPENTISSVYFAAATDPDAIDSLTYSLSGTDKNWLSIDPSSGVITFVAPPDYETPKDSNQDNTYELVINASDGTSSASQELNVSVSNLSDSTPIFSVATDSVTLAENSSSGVVYTAKATDPDGDSLSYDLNGSDASAFSIDSVSGDLSFVASPDYENPQDTDQDNTYELNISASDGISAVSASLELRVSVTDINDNKPQFPKSSETIFVFEDSTSSIYTAQANDLDINDILTYSISGTDASLFTIDSASGDITFLNPPDFENPSDADGDNLYELSITASDGVNSGKLSLKATVINLNDSTPRFAAMSDSAVADENSAASFYTALATDPESSSLSYGITGGDAALFSIDSASGAVAFLSPPDFEIPIGQYADNSYEFNITADDGTYLGEMILTVTVADLNDNAPSFTPDTASATLAENSTAVFYQAAATDPDTVGALTYTLTGTDSIPFTIDPVSGELSAATGLDFEQPSDANQDNTYEIEITASDSIASASLALTVAISNVNDTAPTFTVATESITFTEHSTDVVYTAIAVDPEGDTPSYSVSGTDSSNFTIDSSSGALSFKTPPDYEAATDQDSGNDYELNIIASDGVNSASLALTVVVQDINDNDPSFAASNESISVAENNASSIYIAAAIDLDATDILTYSISGTDSSLLSIDSSSGALSFNIAPDFENPSDSGKDNAYELDITASDGTNQGAQALTITVSNVNEPLSFTTTSVNLSTAENNTGFAHIVEAAIDEDQGQQLSYQLSGADQSAFNLDSSTRSLSFANTPDYENPEDQDTNNAYQIDIIASDGEYESTQSIAIAVTDLNDEAPQFTSLDLQTVDYTLTQVGDIVYTAQATDADAGDQITYALGGTDSANFDFDSSSGELSFNQLPKLEDFPQDGGINYQLTITATDLAANSTDLALTISLLDDTGSAPTFSQPSVSINVDENSPGTIYTAQATDVDVGDTLSYSITGVDVALFIVGVSNGDIAFINPPDYEVASDHDTNNVYELTITATDSMAKQAQQSLSIAVNNLNDNPPQFALSSSTFSVPENTTAITTITATDVDGDDDFTFSLTNTDDANLFTIDPTSGALSFNQAPDFETPQDSNADNTYELELSVADGAHTTTQAISVSVTNVNDVAPSFAAATDSSSVSENTSGVVYTASATDIEGDSVSYSLGGTDSAHFTIDPSNGELSLANALDYETPQDHNTNNDYELEITASDGTNSTTLTLTVLVQDLNDNTPAFATASETIQVPENTSGSIYTAAATDLDATDTITYTLSGTDSALLQIGSSSGDLAFINSPDFENPQDQGSNNVYELEIIASDGANSASLALVIEILDTSERPPEITQLIGGDQAIDFTFDDFGTSKQLSIYRFTDDACSTAELASDHTQCYASGDASSDTAKIDFSGALSSADYQVSDSGLRAGQRYYYQIWAAESSSATDIGVWSVRYSAMTWPAADVGTTLGYDASATTGTQIVLSFVAPSSGDDDYYHFLRHSDPDCASYPAGTALNRADYSDWSALVDPVNGGLCSGLTELTLSSTNLHAPSGNASDSHTDSGLARGTTYYYLLRTVNYSGANGVDFTTRSGASATSNQLQWTTVPPAPAADDLEILSSPAVAADQISIAFASVAGASSYKLVRYIPANCSVADQQIASVESCSASTGYAEQDFSAAQSAYTDSGLQADTTYAYQYRALNAAGSSQYSPAVSATTTTLDKPTISLASSVSLSDANVISVSWSASSGIDSYSILGSSNESCLISATASADPQASAAACAHSINRTAASSTTSTDIDQHDDSSALASGSYYYFAAAAVSSSGSSDYSDVASAITAPASPNVVSLAAGYQQVEVAWDVPTGSAENVLYRYTESTCSLSNFPSNCGLDTGSYTFTNSIPNDSYIDDNSGNGLVDNQMYYYALQASNAGGARYTESASVPVVLTAPKTPTSLIASGEQLAVQLRWGSSPTDADDGVAGYEILRSSSSTCYGSAISAYSDYASCPDAALFLFDYGSGEDQNEYQFSDSELDPSSGSEPLTGGSTYYYWIRSFYGSPSTSDAIYSASTSAPASATPILPAPTNLAVDAEQSASGASTDISIAWDEVATASGYVLYRTTSADCLTIVNRNTSEAQNDCADYQREELSGSSTTATTHSDLPSDTIYYYYVAAANSAVEGELSSALSTRSATVAPTITSTQTYSNTVVRVEWDASSAYDATYHLYAYSGDSSCNPFTTECPHESLTTFTADGSSDYYNYAQQLEPGTHYNFKMLAITEYEQEDGTEDFVHGAISSAAATATTAANHPTITGHEYVDYNYFDLFVSIEGGLDSVLYWVLYTRDANCSVNDVIAGQCAVGGQLGTAEPASSIRLANYDFGVYYYVLSLNSEDYSLLSPDEDTPPYLVPARPAQVELSVNATKNSSGNGSDVKIEWQQSSGVDGYVLYRTTSSGCITDSNRNDSSTKSNCDDYQRQEISGSSTTTTTHSNLPNDTIYHYSVATISNGSEGTLSESIATHTATTAPPIVDVITYNQSQIEVTWWATSAFETDYYIYAYSGDASCDPHAEVCPGEKLVSVAFDFSAKYTTVFTGLTPGTRYNFKAYSNVAYPQENGGTDYIVGYISETAEAKTNYTFANHPTITGHQENDDGDILLEFAIDGGTDDLTYYIFRTTNGECTTTEVVNSESKCTDRGTATATPEQNVVIHKVDDNDYYYHVISANPVGPLAWDDSTEPYYIPSYVVVKDIDVEMTHLVANSNSDFITINFVAAEPIPADNKWTVRFYPALIENSEVREHVFTDEQVTEDLALAFQINAKYYFHPHRFELYASRLDDTDFILLASFIVWDVQPPPLVAVEKNADSNKYSEEKDFDIYIQNYNGDFDVSSVVGIETLEVDITMIFTDADAVLCRPPYVPIVDMIYGNCPLVRSYTDWWDGSELLFNRVEGDTGNQLLHDVVVSNNETYQASQGLFQVYDITFAGTTPIYDDQDDPWSFFVGPYISSFTIDTDFGKYSLDYEEAFSYLSIELAFEEDDMAEFKVYGSSSSASLLPTPTLVLSPALLSQGLSAGSAYNSWDLHLLWEAINGINSYAIHEYSDSDCAYLLSAPELCGNYNLHSSLSPDFTHAFAAADMGSYFYYRLQAYDAAGNSSQLGEQIAVHIPQALNDSGLGLDTCVVSDALSGAQDCASGRDASVAASAKVGSGSAGFDFSLLEADANASSDSHCVHDNTTGLSWSSWSVLADDLASAAEPDSESNATRSSATFAELATITLDACGYSDWSLPSIHELLSIADYNQSEAKIDSSFFTEFNSSQPSYWSASGHILDFSSGDISLEANASAAHSVLLVRSDRRWGHDFGAERFQLVEHIDDGNTSIHLVYDNHSQLHYAPCLAGQSYDPANHSCLGTPTELDYIDSLNAYDSNSTWRQPNIKELIAILDPTHNLLPNPEYFPNPTTNSNPTSDPNSSTDSDSTSDSSTDSTSDTASDSSTNPDSSTGSGSNSSSDSASDTASDSSTDSSSDSSTNSDSNSSASDSTNASYPAPIFILTPSSQSPDYITGRQLNPNTQSTTPTPITQLLNSYLIYQIPD